MRIVALLGNTPDLNHKPERDALESLRPLVANPVFPNNTDEVIDELNNGCEILYFGGHGITRHGIGYINFNDTWIDSRTFANHLKEAVKNKGLKLAIFLSCEGIGLLEDFHRYGVRIPFVIVMTGRILDEAAGRFAEVFFDNYTRGLPFINSFDTARKALSQWEHTLPGISNLPIVYQEFNASDLSVPWYIPIYKYLQELIANRRNRRFWHHRRLFRVALVFLALLISLTISYIIQEPSEVAFCPSFLQKDNELNKYLSIGGNDLFNQNATHLRELDNNTKNEIKQGFQAFQNGCDKLNKSKKNNSDIQDIKDNFKRAIYIFNKHKSKFPDYYVYWQNAKVYQKLAERPEEIKNNQPYIIAVAVPRQVNLSKISQQNTGGEIINGVASFQNRINERTNTKKLVLLLADDRGDKSEEVATHIGKFSLNKNFLLGVIGHAQTRVTKEAARIYQGKKIILISPTSTGQIRNNEKQDDYIYKVVFDVKRLAKDIAEIAEKTSSAQNDKVLVISSSNSFADDFLETIRSNFHEGDDKLILETIENAGRLNIKSLTTQNVKVIVINLTVEDRDSREFLNLLRLVSDFAKNPEPNNKKVIFSDTFYNNKNLQDISMQQLCNNPNLQVVTPAWANDELDKELKKDLPKYSHELYSWRINFAFDSALILMSAAEQSKNNLKPETLKDNIKQGKVSPLVHSSATGLENSLPTFDQAGNRHVNQQQKTSQVWTTKLKDGEQCIFTPGSPIFSGVRRKTTQG